MAKYDGDGKLICFREPACYSAFAFIQDRMASTISVLRSSGSQ
jgi:hypothetical protein